MLTFQINQMDAGIKRMQVRYQACSKVRDLVMQQVRLQAYDQVREQVWEQAASQVMDQVKDKIWDPVEWNSDAPTV